MRKCEQAVLLMLWIILAIALTKAWYELWQINEYAAVVLFMLML